MTTSAAARRRLVENADRFIAAVAARPHLASTCVVTRVGHRVRINTVHVEVATALALLARTFDVDIVEA